MIEICEKSCSPISFTAVATGSLPSIASSSPDTPDATRSRAVSPVFSKNPFSRIQSSLNIFAEIARAVVVEDHDDHVVVA